MTPSATASGTPSPSTTTTASSSRWCKRYCPPGLLGLALTALLASFMSGMAGNVTAFNTVWTYDLYQAYFAPNRSDEHYMRMGKYVTGRRASS
jgi:Na+/proline symporter